jgi:WD40 repeat protein
MRCRTGWIVVATALGISYPAVAQPARGLKPGARPIDVKTPRLQHPISYSNQIVEILEDKCVGCHGSALAENRLSLEDVAAMLKGGKRGPALVRGKADESLLFRMAAHRVEPVMPPKDKPGNSPMTPQELGLLKLWIDAGARDDSAEQPAGAKARQTKPVVLGELPPGLQPIGAVDMTASGMMVAAGRANLVQVYDVDSGLEILSLGGHRDLIQSVRFSPDGRLLAAGSYQIVMLWTVPTGALVKTFGGHAGPVHALATLADGKRVFSGGQDRTIRAWDLAGGKQEWALTMPFPVTALCVLADGRALAAGLADGSIHLIHAATHHDEATLTGHAAAVEGLCPIHVRKPGPSLASVSADGTGRVWDLGAPARTPRPTGAASTVLRGHTGPVRSLAVIGQRELVATGGEDATVRLWNSRDGKAAGVLATGHSGPVTCLAASPDGATLATASADGTARLVSLANGHRLRILGLPAGRLDSIAFSPRGDRVVTAGAEGGLKVWETANGQGVIAFGHSPPTAAAVPPVRRAAFTSDGTLISASADATLKTWTFAGSWTRLGTFGPHVDRVLAIDFSPDGKLLATGGGEPSRSGELKIWDIGKGLLVRSLDSLHSDTVFALRFSPDGTKLASASADRFVKVTRRADGKLLRSFEGHTHHVMAVDWKSDGKQLVSGGADRVLKVWDYDSGEQLRTLQEAGKQITGARWLSAGLEAVAASGDTQVRIWNTENGGIARGFGGAGDYVYAVAASADGWRIAAGGAEGVLFIWDTKSGQVLRKLAPEPAQRFARTQAGRAGAPESKP